jgi:hypothetical protein
LISKLKKAHANVCSTHLQVCSVQWLRHLRQRLAAVTWTRGE